MIILHSSSESFSQFDYGENIIFKKYDSQSLSFSNFKQIIGITPTLYSELSSVDQLKTLKSPKIILFDSLKYNFLKKKILSLSYDS